MRRRPISQGFLYDGTAGKVQTEAGWDGQTQFNADGSARAIEIWRSEHDSGRDGWSTEGNQLMLNVGEYHWTGTYTVRGNQFTLSNVPNYDHKSHTGAFILTRI